MDEKKSETKITFGGGWLGFALTAVIVAARAFQPGAEPMSQWSAWSWVFMTLPTTLPTLCAVTLLLLVLIVDAVGASSRSRW